MKDNILLFMIGVLVGVNMKYNNYYAIDSNQTITITGGELNLNANTPFCYSGKASYVGGTIRVNGKEIQKIPEVESKERQPLVNEQPPQSSQKTKD